MVIVRGVCSGMAFLHAEAFVQGELKSANVLSDANERAKAGFITWCLLLICFFLCVYLCFCSRLE